MSVSLGLMNSGWEGNAWCCGSVGSAVWGFVYGGSLNLADEDEAWLCVQAAQHVATQGATKSSASSGTPYSGKVGDQVSQQSTSSEALPCRESRDLSLGVYRGAGRPWEQGIPHLRKECGEPRSSHIHQKHFFFTFLLFRRKSCFSGTGASAGDLGGEGASSAGSASSRLWRISWNLPSCCRKSYSTLEDREKGRRVTAKWHTLI